MNEKLAAAVKEIREAGRTAPFDEARYLDACSTVIDHRAELTHAVYICLPGGLGGNSDPRWDRIKQNSVERCSCGNERVIVPANPRTEFEASASEPVVVAGDLDHCVYLKPVGGDKESTYLALWIGDSGGGKALAFMQEPFAPFVFSPSMLAPPCYPLGKLAEILPRQTKPAIMYTGKTKTPVFAIRSVDPAAGTATIVLDKDVTVLTPEEQAEEGHKH